MTIQCDHCSHVEVCKYTEAVREAMAKMPRPLTDVGNFIEFSFNCRMFEARLLRREKK